MTERIILSGGREPLTKTIIPLPSLPSQPAPQSSWTTVDIDIDAAEIGKNKAVDYSVCADMGQSLGGLNKLFEEKQVEINAQTMKEWTDDVLEQKKLKQMTTCRR